MRLEDCIRLGQEADDRAMRDATEPATMEVAYGARATFRALESLGFLELHGWRIRYRTHNSICLSHERQPDTAEPVPIYHTGIGAPVFEHAGITYLVTNTNFTRLLAMMRLLTV